MFHAIADGDSPLCFPPRQFERAMRKLHEHGYRSMRLIELAELVRNRRSLPPQTVVITFDDGDQIVYDHAWPVLREFGMTATVFVLPDETEGRGSLVHRTFYGRVVMSWQQIERMHQAGIDFGANTVSHRDLTRLPPEEVEREMTRSRQVLQEVLGAPVSSFAYPYGWHDGASRELARKHFPCARSDDLGLVTPTGDLHALKRIEAYYLRSERAFDLIFTRQFPWYLRVRDVPRRSRRMLVSTPRRGECFTPTNIIGR